ncbi:uncharacterized protein B0H64DRAFT_376445 [Chaetomium fimeti]|uniref:Uncharacterized protein n=1 Tax=Chaetomium fimeti TaxID=1854472 RepID=A0AAE0HBV2_9PEZI|nr:hypothetical protein B0H64DRAFT_376445 [Chaetomium fimeti]
MAVLDPMHEDKYSPVDSLVHQYPDRALFLGSFLPLPTGDALILAICASEIRPLYCRFSIRQQGTGGGVSPSRLIEPNDGWTETVTRRGTRRLYKAGVAVRNPSALLNGVGNTLDTMSQLVDAPGDFNIQPAGDIVPRAEDLRTQLRDGPHLKRMWAHRGLLRAQFHPRPARRGRRSDWSGRSERCDGRVGLATFSAPGLMGELTEMQ